MTVVSVLSHEEWERGDMCGFLSTAWTWALCVNDTQVMREQEKVISLGTTEVPVFFRSLRGDSMEPPGVSQGTTRGISHLDW